MDRTYSGEDAAGFRVTMTTHIRRYPKMNYEDLYKLAYQAAFGSSHAIPDRQKAAECLQEELRNLRNGILEPVLDVISHDGAIARINLRPYMENGGDPGGILRAFLGTAEEFTGSIRWLETYLSLALNQSILDASEMDPEGFKNFIHRMEKLGYPAVHHSKRYRKLYAPAYRVIATRFLKYLDIR